MADVPLVTIADGLPVAGTGTVQTISNITDRLGEVQASPTANTLLDRLKTLAGLDYATQTTLATLATETTVATLATETTLGTLALESGGNLDTIATALADPPTATLQAANTVAIEATTAAVEALRVASTLDDIVTAVNNLDITITALTDAELRASPVAVTIDAASEGILATADVAPGASPGECAIVGGQYNSTPPTVTDTQTVALQVDAAGNLLVSGAISGTITADAGTDLNTSLLALETGGNLDSITAGVEALRVAATLDDIVTAIGGISIAGDTGDVDPGVSPATGIAVLARYNETPPTVTDTQTVALQCNANGALLVSGGTAGTEYTEGAADTTITGSAILWEDASDTLRAVSAAKPLPVNPLHSLNAGAADATTLRVVVASDSPDVITTGSAGTAATEVVTVQGIAAMTPLLVTASAGTNLNTSALALETGGNLATIAGKDFATQTTLATRALETGGNLAAAATSLAIIDDWDASDRCMVNPIVGQAGVAAGAGTVSVTTQRVTLASDDPGVASLSVLDDWDETNRAAVNLIAGQVAITAGSGAIAANTPRVTLATDSPGVLPTAGLAAGTAPAAGVAVLGQFNSTPPTVANTQTAALQLSAAGRVLADAAVTGTVTANAGTNLNTSLLALETGGNLASAVTALQIMDDWDETNRCAVNLISGQVGIAAGTGTDGATVPRVTLATNVGLPAGTNNIGDVDVATIAAGDNNIGNVDIASAIPAGDNNIGNVDVITLPDELSGPGSPVIDSYTTVAVSTSANTANQVLKTAPGANKQIWVYGLVLTADTGDGSFSIQDEDDAAHSGVMAISQRGGFVINPSGNFAMPWIKVATNKQLEIDTVTCGAKGIMTYAIVSV